MLKTSNMYNIDTIDSNENVPEVLVYSFLWFAAILHRASYIKSLAGYLSAMGNSDKLQIFNFHTC